MLVKEKAEEMEIIKEAEIKLLIKSIGRIRIAMSVENRYTQCTTVPLLKRTNTTMKIARRLMPEDQA